MSLTASRAFIRIHRISSCRRGIQNVTFTAVRAMIIMIGLRYLFVSSATAASGGEVSFLQKVSLSIFKGLNSTPTYEISGLKGRSVTHKFVLLSTASRVDAGSATHRQEPAILVLTNVVASSSLYLSSAPHPWGACYLPLSTSALLQSDCTVRSTVFSRRHHLDQILSTVCRALPPPAG